MKHLLKNIRENYNKEEKQEEDNKIINLLLFDFKLIDKLYFILAFLTF